MAPFESLNLSHSVSDRAETVDANRTRAYALLGRTGQELVHAHLAHGNHVAVASPTDHGQVVGPADGLIALVPGTGLTMNFADCSPIMIYDPRLHAMGLGHAGWKGAVADLPGALVRAMQAEFGTIPADLVAAIGPSIGECCYEVGEELQRFIASMKTNAQGGGITPYAGLDTGAMANALRESSVLAVDGTGGAARIAHGLGGSGVGGNGVVEVAAASFGSAGQGSAFSIKLSNVSQAACPSLASVLQRMSETISIGGAGGGLRIVKDAFATPSVPYRAALAQAQCSPGDVNTFLFVAK